jgi:regulatory protein
VTRPTTGDVRLGVDAWLGGAPRPDDQATSSEPVDLVSQGPDADPESVARTILLDQLTGRARSRSELAGKLAAKGVPDDVADRLLSRFEEVGLIDDEAFARSWVQSRQAGKGLARRALAQELRRKGVDDEVARDALDEVDPDAEIEAARVLVRRKLRSVARVDHATAVRRLSGMLARKGYPAGVAFRVVREELEEAGRDADQAIDEDLDGVDPDLP